MKISGGEFKGRTLKTPKGPATRPTKSILREAFFNICQHEIQGARFLDLFAGSGSMGFEALSRGAASVVFVEQNPNAIRCIRENIALLQMQTRAELLPADVFSALKRLEKRKDSFNLIYIDPPYDKVAELAPLILQELKERALIAEHGTVFLEGPSRTKPLDCFSKERTFGNARLYQS